MCLWIFENKLLTQNLKYLHFKFLFAKKIQHTKGHFLIRYIIFCLPGRQNSKNDPQCSSICITSYLLSVGGTCENDEIL